VEKSSLEGRWIIRVLVIIVINLGAGDRLGLGLVGFETLKNVVDLEPKPGRIERERSNTVGLEVIVDLEAAPATVYGLRTPEAYRWE
jgi:hypothetical protein